MMRAVAAAKVNLSLRVGAIEDDGLHRVGGLFQSIGWFDVVDLATADQDQIVGRDGRAVVAGERNLAWKAALAARNAAGEATPLQIVLDKRIPVAAGLGGGSADAAAVLGMCRHKFALDAATIMELAIGLGSDVPFCLRGGTAVVGGTGAQLAAAPPAAGFAFAVVTPPVELATGAVFARWDELGGPSGPSLGGAALPPALRPAEPLINDLYPAAASLAPLLDDWRADLSLRWGRPVVMTGSGPTLFAFFVDVPEATAALDAIPPGARGSVAAAPIAYGWAARSAAGSLWASVPVDEPTKAALEVELGDGS